MLATNDGSTLIGVADSCVLPPPPKSESFFRRVLRSLSLSDKNLHTHTECTIEATNYREHVRLVDNLDKVCRLTAMHWLPGVSGQYCTTSRTFMSQVKGSKKVHKPHIGKPAGPSSEPYVHAMPSPPIPRHSQPKLRQSKSIEIGTRRRYAIGYVS